jgi:plasmid replication initiation protein
MKSDKALNSIANPLHTTRPARAEKRKTKQPELFDTGNDTPLASPSIEMEIDGANVKRERSKLLPMRHERDFFLCDMFDYAIKDDGASMEAPIFTLATKPDLAVWNWKSKDSSRSVEVYPSVKGRATQFDKDVLIFVVSQMTEALNRGRQDVQNRTVRFVVYDYLVSTNKPTGGSQYQRLEAAFDRLAGTRIKTDIKTGGQREKQNFGIIDSWTIIEKSPDDERMIAVEVTLSKWLFNAVQAHEVLTIHRDYFRLRKPLERRLYELARKHCGHQALWTIGLELLREKCGAHSHIRAFRSQALEIINADTLPEYHMTYDREKDQVAFYTKNSKRLTAALRSGKSQFSQ